MKFTAISKQQKDGGFTVTVSGLPGYISEGKGIEEALKILKEDGNPTPLDVGEEVIM